MNKSELVDSVSRKTKVTKASTTKVVDAVFNAIEGALRKKEEVRIINFGTFVTKKRAARQARNPRNGQKINVPACTVPSFRAGKGLRKSVGGRG
jgi:DNA-binding protein HU-beta